MWSSYFSFLGLIFSIAFLSTKFHQSDLTSHHNSAIFLRTVQSFGFITFSVTILEVTEQSSILKLFCASFLPQWFFSFPVLPLRIFLTNTLPPGFGVFNDCTFVLCLFVFSYFLLSEWLSAVWYV